MWAASSAASSHSANGWQTHVASRLAIGVSAALRATAPPQGNMIDWQADGTGISSDCSAKRSIAASGSVVEVVAGPVVPQPRRVVDHPLELGVRHRADEVDGRLQLTEGGRVRLAVGVVLAGPHEGQPAAARALQLVRHERLRRPGQVDDRERQLLRRAALDRVAHQRQQLAAARAPATASARRSTCGPSGWSANSNAVATPKLPPPPCSAQNSSGCSLGARAHVLAVGRHQLDRDQVVAGEPVRPLQPAGAAAEREAGDAGRRDAAAGGGEAVRLRRARRTRPR